MLPDTIDPATIDFEQLEAGALIEAKVLSAGGHHARGVRRLAVLCPAFVADCLETLEEVGIRLRDDWLALGGEELWLAPCPNSDARFAEAVAGWIRKRGPGPRP